MIRFDSSQQVRLPLRQLALTGPLRQLLENAVPRLPSEVQAWLTAATPDLAPSLPGSGWAQPLDALAPPVSATAPASLEPAPALQTVQLDEAAGGLDPEGRLYRESYLPLVAELKGRLVHGGLSYDDYFEALIRHLKPALLPDTLLDYLENYLGEEGLDFVVRDRPNELMRAVELQLGASFVSLLADPGITLRADQFLAFARGYLGDHPEASPLGARRAFIDTFDVETYYRATKLQAGQENSLRRHFVEDDAVRLEQSWQALTEPGTFDWLAKNLPLIGDLGETARYHVRNADTRNPLISVSKYPEVAWSAVAHNGQEVWRTWRQGEEVRVTQFQMNSYYALSRNLLMPQFDRATGEFRVGESFRLAASDPGVELLVPFELPVKQVLAERAYRPSFFLGRARSMEPAQSGDFAAPAAAGT